MSGHLHFFMSRITNAIAMKMTETNVRVNEIANSIISLGVLFHLSTIKLYKI